MHRPAKKAYDLSGAEKRDLIALIRQGKALHQKQRFVLFAEKREIELESSSETLEPSCNH